MFKSRFLCLLMILAPAAITATDRMSSASIQATATVLQPIGFALSSDSREVVARYIDRELPLTSTAFRAHRHQGDSVLFVLAQSVCVIVQRDRDNRTITLISTAD